jgi:2'-5' RNA ligase
MKYFIAHLLSGEAKKYHEALTRALANRYNIIPLHERVPPHLTVKVPFDADESQIRDVERVLRSFARTRHAATLTFSGFGHFGFRTIYLDIVKSAEATDFLREAIRTLHDNIAWLPRPPLEGNKLHASVARFLTRRQFRRIWRPLLATRPRFTVLFDNLAILKREDKAWKVHTVVPVPHTLSAHHTPQLFRGALHEDEALVP